ncbi:MAG: class I SAM-dependent methyltransferase [Clostridia bacterium]|nr:class I SAM-dependent methyltransferase [Clostridia bacterium]
MAYESFAQVYDKFMEDTPYDLWTEYLKEIFKRHGLISNTNIIAELGCGTGNMTQRLAENGFDMIGIDVSEEMLAKAIEKSADKNPDILYLNQDMREFELYGTVDAVISVCDSINYITESADLLNVFKLVNNYLEPEGLFVFDLNTIYKFENILGCNSFCETTENSAYTWENYYDKDERINEFYTNFFIEQNDGSYKRFEEFHYERGYTIEEIIDLIEEAGLEFEACYDELTFHEPTERSQRIFFVAREKMKGRK